MKLRKGDVALVTGASRGLGMHIARALHARGAHLVLTARSVEALELAARQLEGAGDVLVVPADVSQPDDRRRLVDTVLTRFGRVDVLVNNAGVEHAMSFEHVEASAIEQSMAVNLIAPISLTHLVLPSMLKQGQGHVVNIASVAGLMSSPYEELYVASKHGLVGFTRALRASARDMNWPISASAICPGFMDGDGMYETMKRSYGVRAPRTMGTLDARSIGQAVIRAIEKDSADVLLMRGAPRLIAALQVMAPSVFERLMAWTDSASLFRALAVAHDEERKRKATLMPNSLDTRLFD
jgi:short-subunit dehydrogenase